MTDKLTDEKLAVIGAALERVLPVSYRDTPDYAELTFGESKTQAMTMEPATWLALNDLPSAIAEIHRLRGERDEAVGLLRLWDAAGTLSGPKGATRAFLAKLESDRSRTGEGES